MPYCEGTISLIICQVQWNCVIQWNICNLNGIGVAGFYLENTPSLTSVSVHIVLQITIKLILNM